jgi:hypothetical protein
VPAVLSLERRFRARGLRVVSVTKHGDDAADRAHVAETAQEEKMDYPCFLDTDGSWSDKAGLGHVPAFVVVGKDGRLVYRSAGKLVEGSRDYEELAQAIDKALEKGRPAG